MAERSLLILGETGHGKSTFANFVLDERKFNIGAGLIAVTDASEQYTKTINGRRMQIIDTVGFSEASNAVEQHLEQVSKGLSLAPNGVDCIVFAIRCDKNFTSATGDVVRELEKFSELWPRCIVVFTVAGHFGPDDAAQEQKLQELLKSPRCPDSLKALVTKAGGGHILVESVNTLGAGYRESKVAQLLMKCDSIQEKVKVPYKNPMFVSVFQQYKQQKLDEARRQQQEQERLRQEAKQQQIQLEQAKQKAEADRIKREQEIAAAQQKLEAEKTRQQNLQAQAAAAHHHKKKKKRRFRL